MKVDEEEMKAKKLCELEQIYETLNKRKTSMTTPTDYNIQNSQQEKINVVTPNKRANIRNDKGMKQNKEKKLTKQWENKKQSTLKFGKPNNIYAKKDMMKYKKVKCALTEHGENIESLTSSTEMKQTVTFNTPPDLKENKQQKITIKEQERHSYTARFKIHIVQDKANVGLILYQIMELWRNADSTSVLHNFFDEECANDMIDHENKIPDDEELLKKYMAGTREVKGKLLFALKFSGKCNMKYIKGQVYPWMAANRSYVTMDKLKSERIITLGFFTKVHPDYHNRTDFKASLEEMLMEQKIKEKVNLYPRKIWTMNKGIRIVTRALVIEVPSYRREEISEVLITQKNQCYTSAEYVPFSNINDNAYEQMMANIFTTQNQYLHSLDQKTVYGVNNAQEEILTKRGIEITFQDWVEQLAYDGIHFIDTCEIGQNGSLHIIYEKKYEHLIQKLFSSDMATTARDFFHEEVVKKIFGTNVPKVVGTRQFTPSEIAYADVLKRKYVQQNNPNKDMEEQVHEHHPMKLNKKNLYYSKFAKPNIMKQNTHEEDSRRESNMEQVMNRLTKLEEASTKTEDIFNDGAKSEISTISQEEWSKSLEEKIMSKMQDMNINIMKTVEQNRKTTVTLIEESEQKTLRNFEERLDTKLERRFENFFSQMEMLMMNKSTTDTLNVQRKSGSGKIE